VEIIKRAEDVVDNARQHYPPGTQESNKSFESRDLMMEKGKELECTRRAGGGKGEPGVPPKLDTL